MVIVMMSMKLNVSSYKCEQDKPLNENNDR